MSLYNAEQNGWQNQDQSLCKTMTFKSFPDALSFMVRSGFEAEKLNHHPDWTNIYNKVIIKLTTHDANSLTDKDYILAEKMDQIYQGFC